MFTTLLILYMFTTLFIFIFNGIVNPNPFVIIYHDMHVFIVAGLRVAFIMAETFMLLGVGIRCLPVGADNLK